MLCRATNALISVRLIYNNLRKKYRNFCFLFCSFVCFPFLLPPLIFVPSTLLPTPQPRSPFDNDHRELYHQRVSPKYVALKTA